MMAALQIDQQKISLKQLLADILPDDFLPNIPVSGLTLDSRKVAQGFVFIALSGQTDHGLTFAQEAIDKGAVAILCDKKFDQYCQQIVSSILTRTVCIAIDDLKNKVGEIADNFYASPSKKLFTVGITGTDGKTSVSHFISQSLNQAAEKSAVMGTIGNGLIDDLHTATHTTPDVIEVHKLIAESLEKNASSLCMEVSSHGLQQQRVDNVDFNVAVLTNLGRDHLDYHGNLSEYKKAKKRLFEKSNVQAVVLNIDDEFGIELAGSALEHQDVWLYSLSAKNDALNNTQHCVYASNINVNSSGLQFHVNTPVGEADVNLYLLGEFNVANALATLCVLLIKGVEFNDAIQRLEKLQTVNGRMQTLSAQNKPLVVVDFAHTPQALTSSLSSLRKHCKKILHCVFGCGGERDQGKRPLMAAIAENLADKVIVTQDNPRYESSEKIQQDIFSGFENPENIYYIEDRKLAIETAISQANKDDIVLIAGKGHEKTQLIAEKKIAFDDVKIAADILFSKSAK